MASLSEMMRYADYADRVNNPLISGIEGAFQGYQQGKAIEQQKQDRELERAGKFLDLQSKVATMEQTRLMNETLKTITGAQESDARASAFQNLGAQVTAGVDGAQKNTNSGKFDSTVTDPKALSKRGYTTEMGISDGKPYVKLKQEQAKPKSTVGQLQAIQKYIDTKDPADLATAFPDGEMPEWATKFMATAHENKLKADAINDQKDQVKTQQLFGKMSEAIDPSKQRNGSFGVSKQVFDRAERLQSLAARYPDGNLTSNEIEELGIGLNSLLSGSNTGASEQVKALIPQSAWGDVQKRISWFINNPRGTEQQAFVQRMLGSVDREKQTAATQIKRTQFARLSPYASLEQKDPATFASTLQSYGIEPDEYQSWKKSGFKSISAVVKPGEGEGSAGGAQGGYLQTATNPKTGEKVGTRDGKTWEKIQ